jgi:hypothetical protein
VGRCSVDVDVANYADLIRAEDGRLPPERVRRETINAVVDCGAAKLVLPEAVVKRLGLPLGMPMNVQCVDGRRAKGKGPEGVYLQLLGRHGTFTAISEPKRDTALIGAIVLEDLDLLVDCTEQKIVPRDPTDV